MAFTLRPCIEERTRMSSRISRRAAAERLANPLSGCNLDGPSAAGDFVIMAGPTGRLMPVSGSASILRG